MLIYIANIFGESNLEKQMQKLTYKNIDRGDGAIQILIAYKLIKLQLIFLHNNFCICFLKDFFQRFFIIYKYINILL